MSRPSFLAQPKPKFSSNNPLPSAAAASAAARTSAPPSIPAIKSISSSITNSSSNSTSSSTTPFSSSASSAVSASVPFPPLDSTSDVPQYWIVKLPQFIYEEFAKKLKQTQSIMQQQGNQSNQSANNNNANNNQYNTPIAHIKLESNNNNSLSTPQLKLIYSPPNDSNTNNNNNNLNKFQPTEFLIKGKSNLSNHHQQQLLFADLHQHSSVSASQTQSQSNKSNNNNNNSTSSTAAAAAVADPLYIGSIDYIADVTQIDSADYRAMLKSRLIEKMTKSRSTKLIDPNTQMAQTPAMMSLQSSAKRKSLDSGNNRNNSSPPDKRVRSDRPEAESKVLHAFHNKDYLSLKQLLESTQEPIGWLKEILNDLCIRQTKGEYINHYQLKEQFRITGTE